MPQFAPKGWHEAAVPTHRGRRPGEGQDSARPALRHEPAQLSRRHLSDRRELLEYRDGAGQPVRRLVVVPQSVRRAGFLQGKDGLAEVRRHQLPRQHLAERKADRQFRRRRRRMAHLRIQCHRGSQAGRGKRARGSGRAPPPNTISPSPLSTGIPRLRTRTWASGATYI